MPAGGGLRPRPHVYMGDWVITKAHGSTRCRMYPLPPSVDDQSVAPITVPQGTYLGPVRAVEHTSRFVSVRVEPPFAEFGPYVWVNIWARAHDRDGLGHHFAYRVCDRVRNEWRDNGWQDLS